MRKDLLEELRKARLENRALGAFNVFNYTSARAVIDAAEECQSPVIVQTAQYVVQYYGTSRLADIIMPLIEKASVPVFLHLDHCTEPSLAKECTSNGWDSIMIDASRKSLEDNINITAMAASNAKSKSVYTEGEIGVIKGKEDGIVSDKEINVDYADICRFAKESDIDLLAPAMGTVHGTYSGAPKLNYELIAKLDKDLRMPLVCHGGSGLSPDVFHRLISLGITKINVATAIKESNILAVKSYLDRTVDYSNPILFEDSLYQAIKKTVINHIAIFRGICVSTKSQEGTS